MRNSEQKLRKANKELKDEVAELKLKLEKSNEMLFRVLGSKFGMGYLKFLKKDRKKLLKYH